MEEIPKEEEERTRFFRNIGPQAAEKMSEAFYKLTGEKIAVSFGNIQTYKECSAIIDVNEKCFGTYVTISSDDIHGIAFLFFPIQSMSKLVDLVLKKQYFADETISAKMKLSTFKEVNHILLLTYVTELANSLGTSLKTSPSKFVHFKSMKLTKYLTPESINAENLTSVGQFSISYTGSAGGGGVVGGWKKTCQKEGSLWSFKGGFCCYISKGKFDRVF